MVSENLYISIVLTLAVSYTITFGFCMYQTNKFTYINEKWRNTKIFYVSVIAQIFTRMTTYALLTFAVQSTQRSNPFIVVMRSVPDTFFFINYTLLIYQAMNIFYESHMENRLHISLLVHFTRPKFQTVRKVIVSIIVGWLGFMSLIYALLILGKITSTDVDTEFTVVNLLSATFVLVYLTYLYTKYQETPFKSKGDRQKLRVISRVLMVWTLGRYFQGFIGLLNLSSASFLSYLSNPQDSTLGGALLFISQGLLSEIACFLYVLSPNFINLFIEQEEAIMNADEQPAMKSFVIETQNSRSSSEIGPFLDEQDVKAVGLFKRCRNGFGDLLSAEFLSKPVLYRRIIFSKITDLALADIKKDVDRLKTHNFPGILHFYGAIVKLPEIGLLYPIAPKSLYKLLHDDRSIVSLKEKLKILKEIGNTLNTLHSKGLCHGHLSSHNILLFENNTPVIGDLGLEILRKYASTINGYSNKTVWSSPELLAEPTPIVFCPRYSDDVYSYGVLIWEVLTGEIPFEELTANNYRQEICQGNKSPHIPQFFPKPLVRVLKMCWSPLETRAKISQVYEKVINLKFGD